MDEAEVLRIINEYNPWWAGKEIPKSSLGTFERKDIYYLKRELEVKQITSIIGPRRVGKTILLHQLIKHLLDQKIEPQRIFYLSVDENELKRAKAELSDILAVYSKFVAKKPLNELKEKHYIFLDEIQSVDRWSIILKNWYDLRYNIKFVISGSSSMALAKGSKESLLGRINTCILLPLKFSEILRYEKVFDTTDFLDTRRFFIHSIINNNPELLFSQFQNLLGKTASIQNEIEILLNRYLIVGGYPEFLELKDDYTRISKTMQEKIKSTFYKDIILFFKIRNPKILNELFLNLAVSSSQKINIANAAKDLDIKRPTLKTYLEHFLDIFLISKSEFYSKSRRVRTRKLKRIYVNDPGIRNSSIGHLDEMLIQDSKEVGLVMEGIVYDHLKRLKFILERGSETEVFYWEGKKEVNFVIELKRKAIPIELKYQSEITNSDTVSLKEFISKFKSPFGILITKKMLKLEEKILFVPLWLFLLMI